MKERDLISEKMRAHDETAWQPADAWGFDTSESKQTRYALQLRVLAGQRYDRVLEIDCGPGCIARHLDSIADRLVALDIAEAAIVGYLLEIEENFRGTKSGVDFAVLLTLFRKADSTGVGT